MQPNAQGENWTGEGDGIPTDLHVEESEDEDAEMGTEQEVSMNNPNRHHVIVGNNNIMNMMRGWN